MLARMEMKCAFREIVDRLDDFTIDVPYEKLDIWGTFVFRGPRSLPATFRKRTAGVAT
jgi:cytochrome P450